MFQRQQSFLESPDGNRVEFTLSASVVEGTLVVFADGSILPGTAWTRSTNQVTFATAPATSAQWSGFVGNTLYDDINYWKSQVNQHVHDEEEKIDDDGLQALITQAITQDYSIHFPLHGEWVFIGTDQAKIPVPDAMNLVFSKIVTVLSLDLDGFPQGELPCSLLRTPGQMYLVPQKVPAFTADTLYWVFYTLPHSPQTIDPLHVSALVDLISSLYATELAAAYVQEIDTSTGTIELNRLPKPSEYRQISQRYLSRWENFIASVLTQAMPSAMTQWNPVMGHLFEA